MNGQLHLAALSEVAGVGYSFSPCPVCSAEALVAVTPGQLHLCALFLMSCPGGHVLEFLLGLSISSIPKLFMPSAAKTIRCAAIQEIRVIAP